MSVTIHARGVAARQGDRELFAGLDLIVAPGEVVGLVGPNGAGKSTLLRILAGRRPPDAGSVRVTPATAHLGYLAQQAERVTGETVRDYLARRTGVTAAEAEFNAQSMALSRSVDAADAYSDALESWLDLGAADFEERLAEVMASGKLGVDADLPMTALSGGQAARVSLGHCCSRASTPTCSTSPRTISTSTAWTCWRTSSLGWQRRWSWSATIASSWLAPSRASSRSTAAFSGQ